MIDFCRINLMKNHVTSQYCDAAVTKFSSAASDVNDVTCGYCTR
jgi:hypothetical protein